MITPDSLDLKHQQLFSLLRAALWHKAPDEKLFSGMTEEDWSKLVQASIHHGVLAIVYDGMLLLPMELHPSKKIKLSWAVNVDALEKRYHHQVEVAKEIGILFKNNGIDMLLFKGIGLAQMYPVPEHREFGDIDIYLFGKMEEGNQLLMNGNAKKRDHNTDKHDGLSYKGVSIENHRYFLSEHNSSDILILENYLSETASAPNRKTFPEFSGTGIVFPSPDFNAVFLMEHALHHFTSSLVLRYFCDWVCFLHANKGEIDFSKYREILSKNGLLSVADTFTGLCVNLLSLPPEEAPPYEADPVLESRMLTDILCPLLLPKDKRLPWDIILYKIRLLKKNKWKYELIHRGRYYKYLLRSVYAHIVRPSVILKLK